MISSVNSLDSHIILQSSSDQRLFSTSDVSVLVVNWYLPRAKPTNNQATKLVPKSKYIKVVLLPFLTIYNYMHIVNCKSIPQMAKSPLVSRGYDVIEPSYFGAIIRRLIVNHDMPAQSHTAELQYLPQLHCKYYPNLGLNVTVHLVPIKCLSHITHPLFS